MAVYKATYCFPYSNSVDIRIVPSADELKPCKYLKCKIDSSNKNIIGYTIKVLDNNNKQIFPVGSSNHISPILELPQNLGDNINTGINGTYLYIPFFQNYRYPLQYQKEEGGLLVSYNRGSYNAVYYKGDYEVSYIIFGADNLQPENFPNFNDETSHRYDTVGDIPSDFEEEGTVVLVGPSGSAIQYVYYTGNWLPVTEVVGANRADGWNVNGTYTKLSRESWDGVLNGEIAEENETVLCVDSSNKIGIWQVQGDGSLIPYTDPNTGAHAVSELNNKYILITKGVYAGRVYHYTVGGGFELLDETTVLNSMWVSYNGLTPYKFDLNNGSYKWIITLYQGPSISGYNSGINMPGYNMLKGAGDMFSPYYIDFSNMGEEWYDMTLSSGRVMGSTKDRIQLSDVYEATLPGEGGTSTIVLQGRYLQLLNTAQQKISSRVYVQQYDATYGHAYPLEGYFAQNSIDSARYCQFYKYSNSIDSILAQDIVQYADNTTTTIPTDLTWHDLSGATAAAGDRVLFMNMADKADNGIYIASDGLWSRGSFTSWGDYIGKIIFVEKGYYSGTNFESEAQAGGILKYPAGGSATGTALFFIEEQPIILFPKQIKFVADAYAGTNALPTNTSTTIDGVMFNKTGMTAARSASTSDLNLYLWTVTNIDGAGNITWALTQTFTDSPGTIVFRVLQGATYGGRLWEWTYSGGWTVALSSRPQTAKILTNSSGRTFIQPYSGLQKTMLFKLLNNQRVTLNDSSTTNYLKITHLDTKLWYIQHAALADPMPSYSDTDSSIPYQYSIKSYFQEGDENPFITCYDPYLKLGTPDEGGSNIDLYQDFYTMYGTGRNWQAFSVIQDLEESPLSYSDFTVLDPSMTIGVSRRYITLYGFYFQKQQASWESYRWVLLDGEGEILQDTGKKYDKTMKVSFYGLANDYSSKNNIYYAVLYVEDSLNNTLSTSLRIVTTASTIKPLDINFVAKYDCATRSVGLYYEANAIVSPSVTKGDTSYVYNAEGAPLDLWDGSLNYEQSRAYITNTDSTEFRTPIYDLFNKQSHLSDTVNLGLDYRHFFDKGVLQVGAYDHRLSIADTTGNDTCNFLFSTDINLNDNYCGEIVDLTLDLADNTHTLHISFYLPSNFSTDADDDLAAQNTLNPNRNKIHYKISTNVPDISDKIGILLAGVNTGYQLFRVGSNNYYYLQREDASDLEAGYAEFLHYTAFEPDNDLSDPTKCYYPYFLYPQYGSGEATLVKNGKTYNFVINGSKFWGNCCLISDFDIKYANGTESESSLNITTEGMMFNNSDFSKNAPAFWQEERHYAVLYMEDGEHKKILSPVNLIYGTQDFTYFPYNPTTGEGGANISWPEDDSDYYWHEYYDETSDYSITKSSLMSWNDVITDPNVPGTQQTRRISPEGFYRLIPYDRHPNQVQNKTLRLNIRVTDLENLVGTSWETDAYSANNGYNCTTVARNGADAQVVFEIREVS